MTYSDDVKEKMLFVIADMVIEDPSMYGRVIKALDRGLAHALSVERQKSSQLAWSLLTILQGSSPARKTALKFFEHIWLGLFVMLNDHFRTAPIEKDIIEWFPELANKTWKSMEE